MAEDVRVILLKLADRLHNMRTLNHMPIQKQKRIAQETLEIFAPLANRLGIGRIKAELEDLALRYTEPEKYYEVVKNVAQTKAERDEVVQTLIETIQLSLQKAGIKCEQAYWEADGTKNWVKFPNYVEGGKGWAVWIRYKYSDPPACQQKTAAAFYECLWDNKGGGFVGSYAINKTTYNARCNKIISEVGGGTKLN